MYMYNAIEYCVFHLFILFYFSSVGPFGLEESTGSSASVLGGAVGGADESKPKISMTPEEVARRVVSILKIYRNLLEYPEVYWSMLKFTRIYWFMQVYYLLHVL